VLFARSLPSREGKPNRLKNQQLGGGQVVVCKILGGWAEQPNLSSTMPQVESQVVVCKIPHPTLLVTELL
jgi:hypothetical protein